MLSSQFYALNEIRGYPFDPSGSMISDDKQPVPEGILVDASISFNQTYGTRVKCTAISKTSAGTSIVFGTQSQAAIAIATIPNGFIPHEAIAIEPILAGVTGYVVPGEPLERMLPANLLFTGDYQLLLSPRVAFPVPLQNTQSFATFNSQSVLKGLILLEGLGDMSIRIEPRVLGGVQKTAIVFRLSDVIGGTSVLGQYAGPNQQRPEARTCGDPAPIETINQVAADCCGRIYLELRGCAQPIPITNHCGVVLDCPQEPAEMCSPKPTYTDKAPNDFCIEQGEADPLTPPVNPPKLPSWYSA